MKLKVKASLEERIKSCNICKLNSYKALGWGSPSAKVLLLGQNPSSKIKADRLAFQSSGILPLFQAMKELKIDSKKFYYTNLVKCATPENREPTKEEVQNCSNFMKSETTRLNYQTIICLGKVVGERYGISKLYTGRVDGDISIWLLPHPSYVKRFPANYEKFKSHLGMILKNENIQTKRKSKKIRRSLD